MTMVIKVIDGYRWLFMVISVYLNSAMVILVIGVPKRVWPVVLTAFYACKMAVE